MTAPDLCPLCSHNWHGLQCQRHHESGAQCACPTAYRGDSRG